MTKWQKLRKRLKEELNIETEDIFDRTYAGRHQRSMGAFVWTTLKKGCPIGCIGSRWSMTNLLKAKYLCAVTGHGDLEIIPERNKKTLTEEG